MALAGQYQTKSDLSDYRICRECVRYIAGSITNFDS
jgi:hypothetical protein